MTFDKFMEMQIDPGWTGATELASRAWEHQQAEIDALMLEYCPEDMTPEQIANWERHQQAVPNTKVSGAGTASAGLPGYAGDNNGER